MGMMKGRLLAAGCWSLAAGIWLPDSDCWSLVIFFQLIAGKRLGMKIL
jgi:hypothetical protein